MTPTIVTLKEVLDHHPTLSPGGRAFCAGLVTQGDMLAVTAIVVAMLALSGCSTMWSRAATSDAEFNLDSRACQHMNTKTVFLSSVWVRDYVMVSGYKRCMMQEGYTEGGFWKGHPGWRDE